MHNDSNSNIFYGVHAGGAGQSLRAGATRRIVFGISRKNIRPSAENGINRNPIYHLLSENTVP